jgi:hypothetical protein
VTTPYEIRQPGLRNRLLTIMDISEEIADAALELLKPELSAFAEYESAINWHTTCTSCARILDSAYKETVRAEKAEQALEQYEESVVGDLNEKNINLARTVARLQKELDDLKASEGAK